jgi:DNA-binding transcriptional ArsR family regulator
MTIKLKLIKDKKVLFELPLSASELPRKYLGKDLLIVEQELEKMTKLFDALSHETRIKMMKLLIEDDDFKMGFADFMRLLDLNPKLVWENTQKLQETGLLKKSEDGKYQCSELGKISFLMFSLAFKHLVQTIEELEKMGGEM